MNLIYKITRYLLLISIFVSAIYFCVSRNNAIVFGTESDNNNSLNPNVNSIVSIDEEKSFEYTTKIIDILIVDKYTLYVSNSCSYLVDEDVILEIDARIIDFIVLDNIYFISKERLYKYDYTDVSSVLLDAELVDFEISNDTIYLCGVFFGDAYICEYSLDLLFINDNVFGGNGYECFEKVNYFNNQLYLIGEKDSTSFYSPFKNCGLIDTRKTFMITYSPEKGITNEVYFNITKDSEYFKEVIYDDYIYLVLSTNEIICLDYSLEVIPISKNTITINKLLLSINKELLIFSYSNQDLYLDDRLFYQANAEILKIGLKQGYLVIYLMNNNIVTEQILFEYHVDKNEELICSKYYYDLNSLNNLEVNSYFEELTKEIKTYEPYFQKQIDGEYKIKYLITRTNKKTFLIDGKLIVKHFVNIIDGGVYKVNKELSFYGKGLLNGKEIYNGYILNQPGTYELILENVNGIKRTYNFKVVNNYYLDDVAVTFIADYLVNQNEQLDVVLDIENIDINDIEDIIVNNQSFNSYNLVDDLLYLHFNGKDYYSIDVYNINKIVLRTNNLLKEKEIIINKVITIKTLNNYPTITLHQSSKLGTINLNYQIVDESKSILYLKSDILVNGEIVNTYYNYFNNEKTNYQKLSNDSSIRHSLVVNDGNSLNEIIICEYKIDQKDLNKIENVDYSTDLSINNLNIDLETTSVNYEYLNVENQNLISSIEIISALINYQTIIYITIPIFLISFIYIIIRKKIKKKKLNQLK